MKAVKLEFLFHDRPENCSCGTGYSEPDYFRLYLDNGVSYEIWFDIWYKVYNENDAREVFSNDWKLNVKDNPILCNVENTDYVCELFIEILKERGPLKEKLENQEVENTLKELAGKHDWKTVIENIPEKELMNWFNDSDIYTPSEEDAIKDILSEMTASELLEAYDDNSAIAKKISVSDFLDTHSIDEILGYIDVDDAIYEYSDTEVLDCIDRGTIERYLENRYSDYNSVYDDYCGEDKQIRILKLLTRNRTKSNYIDKKLILDTVKEIVDFEMN